MIVVDGNASLGSNDQIADHLVKDRQAYPNWENHDSSRHCLHFYAREHMAWVKCRSRKPSRIRLLFNHFSSLTFDKSILTGIHRGENVDSS